MMWKNNSAYLIIAQCNLNDQGKAEIHPEEDHGNTVTKKQIFTREEPHLSVVIKKYHKIAYKKEFPVSSSWPSCKEHSSYPPFKISSKRLSEGFWC